MRCDTSQCKRKSAPAKYRRLGATSRADYADPCCFKYPIAASTQKETYRRVKAAITRICKPDNYLRYPVETRKAVAARILKAATAAGIETGPCIHSLARSGRKARSK